MSRRITVCIDCVDPARLEDFWKAALGYVRVDWPGENYLVLVPDDGGAGPVVLLQQVPEPKAGKNRVHLDVHVQDPEAEADRLVGLGAERLSDGSLEEHGASWIVMADPLGNEFCLCRAHA